MPESAPARIVQITMSILNLEHELVNLDLWKGEARTPEYLEVGVTLITILCLLKSTHHPLYGYFFFLA